MTDEEMRLCEQTAANAQAEAAYAELRAAGPEAQYEEYVEHAFPEPLRPAFVVDTLALAAWALKKITAAERRKSERAAFVAQERARLEAWQVDMDAREQRGIDFMTQALEGYYRRQREAGELGKAKSLRLPGGRLQMRETGGDWTQDETPAAQTELLIWAQMNSIPGAPLTRKTESPAWNVIKAGLAKEGTTPVWEKTGEVVPGVLQSQVREEFRVKIEEE